MLADLVAHPRRRAAALRGRPVAVRLARRGPVLRRAVPDARAIARRRQRPGDHRPDARLAAPSGLRLAVDARRGRFAVSALRARRLIRRSREPESLKRSARRSLLSSRPMSVAAELGDSVPSEPLIALTEARRAHADARRRALRRRARAGPLDADEPAGLGPRATSPRSRICGSSTATAGARCCAPTSPRPMTRSRPRAPSAVTSTTWDRPTPGSTWRRSAAAPRRCSPSAGPATGRSRS